MLSSKQTPVQCVIGGGGLSTVSERQHEECDELPKERSTALTMRRTLMIVVCLLCLFPLVACLALTRFTTPSSDTSDHRHAAPSSPLVTQSVTWSRTGRDVSSMVTAMGSSNSSHDLSVTNSTTRVPFTTDTVTRTAPSPSVKPVIPNVYFANDSLLGTAIPCTDAEKECLRFNRLLFPADGKCYALGDGPGRCHFAVHRCEFENRSRHVRGTCVPSDLCPSTPNKHVRLAFDGRCVKLRQLRHFCGKGPVDLVPHFFGDFECSAVHLGLGLGLEGGATPYTYIPQPPESGRCVFPNLRHDLTSVLDQERRPWLSECSEEQSVCFASNAVWCGDVHRCCALLRRNHCPEGQWVALNRTAWVVEGAVEASCVGVVDRCADAFDGRLMAFDGRCHRKQEVLRALCPNGVLLPNAFGEWACVTRDFYKHVIRLRSARPGLCEVAHRLSHDDDDDDEESGLRLTPECALTGFRNCVDAF